jgi:hypothetical protein
MNQQFQQGYWLDRVFSNLNQHGVDQLDDADREQVEPAGCSGKT